ncbi:MAG TPA: MBOAT family O-acyltransferase, partial [Parvularculaceae bacterium]|nr:MBOAT family O-acyltransferase [Parvularculaceae bacterium]
MLFNSLTFVVFFAIVVALHNAPLPWRAKKFNLLIASYLFYAAWNPPFVILLLISTMVDWKAAQWIHGAKTEARRKLFLVLSLAVNLGFLGFFKYGGFLLENFTALMGSVGVAYKPPEWDIILPVGISFYTFQTMAYSLDVYLRRAAPTKSFLDFALFVTFFPQLVAGPIVRPSQLVPQFAEEKRATRDQFHWGLALMTLGLFEKVVLADSFLAPAADGAFGAHKAIAPLDAWTGVLAFSGQIFFDFSGYSTIAIGSALCLGFALPNNFRFPYAAIGFSDFWRRWHISLSTWLRDYLYIPLGGNRGSETRTYVNLMLTMLLGGLWHGASWTFVAWGGLHGFYLAAERWIRSQSGVQGDPAGAWNRFALALATYFLVNITWVFFRAETFEGAARILAGMAGLAAEPAAVLPTVHMVKVAVIVAGMVAVQWLMRNRSLEAVVARTPWWLTAVAVAAMLFAV